MLTALTLVSSLNAQQIQLTIPVFDDSDTGGAPIIGYDLQLDDGRNGPFRCVLGGDRSKNTL